jgi:hypothetical protein
MALIAHHQPGPRGDQDSSTSQLVGSGVLGVRLHQRCHRRGIGASPFRIAYLRPPVLAIRHGTGSPGFQYCFCYAHLRLQQTAVGEKPLTRETFALSGMYRLLKMRFYAVLSSSAGGHRCVLDTDTLTDLTFLCVGYIAGYRITLVLDKRA